MIEEGTGAGDYTIEGGSNGGWLKVVFAIAILVIAAYFVGSLLLAGFIGPFGAFLGIFGAVASYFKLLSGLGEINNDEQLNRLVAFTALKGLASILLSSVTMVFYNALISFGPLTQVLPFSLLNFGIFFVSGWFF